MSGPIGFGAPMGGVALPAGIPVLGAGGVGSVGESVSSDPSTGAGLKRAPGTLVAKSDGSAAWVKTGTADTAWTLVAGAPRLPYVTAAPDEWYLWGIPSITNSNVQLSGTCGSSGVTLNNGMFALPHWLGEAGTVTQLAQVAATMNVPVARDSGWIGLAPNKFVAGLPYPDLTATFVPCTQPTGLATGGAIALLGGAINYVNKAGELVWLIFQGPTIVAGAGPYWNGLPTSLDYRDLFGSIDLRGPLALNTRIAAPVLRGQIGWQTGTGAQPAYVQGGNFPAAQARMDNVGPNWINPATGATAAFILPAVVYQWERA